MLSAAGQRQKIDCSLINIYIISTFLPLAVILLSFKSHSPLVQLQSLVKKLKTIGDGFIFLGFSNKKLNGTVTYHLVFCKSQ